MGKMSAGELEEGCPSDWLGVRIRISLVGPTLETGER